ncbi:hypothetical protein GX48_01822 [Paracoccidioides brasiliensis]|nr:hypothetical protein GX48_01822 [Paracoccidioides brasiliensis]
MDEMLQIMKIRQVFILVSGGLQCPLTLCEYGSKPVTIQSQNSVFTRQEKQNVGVFFICLQIASYARPSKYMHLEGCPQESFPIRKCWPDDLVGLSFISRKPDVNTWERGSRGRSVEEMDVEEHRKPSFDADWEISPEATVESNGGKVM